MGWSGGLGIRQKKSQISTFPPRGMKNGEEGGVHLHRDFNWDRVVSCGETRKDGIESVQCRFNSPADFYAFTGLK
jgi:hypothetical protein